MNGCHHHWMIESPDGPTSPGVCRLCGETGDFPNVMPYEFGRSGHRQFRMGKRVDEIQNEYRELIYRASQGVVEPGQTRA